MNKNRFAAVLSVLLLSLSLPAAAQTQGPSAVMSAACAARVHDPIDVMRDPIDVMRDPIDVMGGRTCPAALAQEPIDVMRDPIDVMKDPIDVMSIQP